jgi:O-antigen ligase
LGLIIIATRLEIIHTETGGNRDAALTVALVGCVCLAGIESRAWIALIGWVGCIVLILLSASRTAAVALLSVVVLHPLYRGMGHRLLAILGIAACGLALFYSPIIQQRMFHSGSGSIRDLLAGNDVDTSGRFEAWPVIWEEAWKRPLLGAGVGTASPFVQRIWPGVSHPHNDYVRIGFEQGLIGLTIFVSVVGWQLLDLLRGSAVSTGLARQTFVASFLGLLALTITCITDNTLVYNLSYTDPLFALMGAAYGFHLGDGEPWRRRW